MVDCVAIVSGGMDSVTLIHHLVKNDHLTPAIISFSYGQKHTREIECAKFNARDLNCNEHHIVDLTDLNYLFSSSALVSDKVSIPNIKDVKGNPQPPTYVPNRNMIFLSLAAAYAENIGVSSIYYGAQSHDLYGYWDTTSMFLERLNSVYSLNRSSAIQIKAPFVNYTKADILRLGMKINVDYSRTWSCYTGKIKACGNCPTCAERLNAFSEVGIVDPVEYEQD